MSYHQHLIVREKREKEAVRNVTVAHAPFGPTISNRHKDKPHTRQPPELGHGYFLLKTPSLKYFLLDLNTLFYGIASLSVAALGMNSYLTIPNSP